MTPEAARLHLYERARNAMDDDAANTLMGYLPWKVDDLATKEDILLLKHDVAMVRNGLEMLAERIEAVGDRVFRRVLVAMLAVNTTTVGAVVLGVQLVRG